MRQGRSPCEWQTLYWDKRTFPIIDMCNNSKVSDVGLHKEDYTVLKRSMDILNRREIVSFKKTRSRDYTGFYNINPSTRRRMPPTTVAAPRTDGIPATGVLGTGSGVAVTTTCLTISFPSGMGVAVTMTTLGHVQDNSDVHSGFLHRFTPSTLAQMRPL